MEHFKFGGQPPAPGQGRVFKIAPLIPIRSEEQLFPPAEASKALSVLRSGQVRGAAVLMTSRKTKVWLVSKHLARGHGNTSFAILTMYSP